MLRIVAVVKHRPVDPNPLGFGIDAERIPDHSTTSAFFPTSIDPILSSRPSAQAGFIVSQRIAWSSVIMMPLARPAYIAFATS